MARIRTIKPEFFRHEALQDLEAENNGSYVMLVFAGLWGHCDSKGRFEWRPRQLKLDILPFLEFSMAKTLEILRDGGLLIQYEVDGKVYGEITSFEKHQRITGKEATEGEKHPERPKNDQGKQRGNNGETTGKDQSFTNVQEGKGREKERKEEGERICAPPNKSAPPEKSGPDPETELQAACRETWRAYSTAFFARYQTEPVRNAKVNSSIKGFVQRVGRSEAPHIAEFYVGHNDAFYIRKCHDPGQLQSDAEKLRTEWATNRKVTSITARQQERVGTMADTVAEILAERGQA